MPTKRLKKSSRPATLVVKDQLHLMKIESQLEKVLENINEYMNTLFVEQMELSSALVNQAQAPTAATTSTATAKAENDAKCLDASNLINTQLLDLDKIMYDDVEEEDEEDEEEEEDDE